MVILFDGYCGLCNKSVDWLLEKDAYHHLMFSSLQGDFAKTLPLTNVNLSAPNSLVVWENNKAFQKSEGVFRILKKLPFPWKLFLIFSILPSFITDATYDIIARNRNKWFGKSQSCRIPTQEEKHFFID